MGIANFIRSEPVVVWIGLIDTAVQVAVAFNLVPGGFSAEQKGAVDALVQVVFAIIVRAQVKVA